MHFGFSTTNKLVSRVIRWFTRSKASHNYICFDVAGETLVLHATSQGVNMDYWERFKKKNKIVAEYKLTMTKANQNKALAYMFKKLDRPYDYLALVGFAWVLFMKALGKRVGNPFPNRSAYFCSELAAEALKAAGFSRADELDRELTSPEDLIEFFNSHNKAELVA